MPWAAAGAIGSAAIGAIAGSQKSGGGTTSNTSSTQPWAPQQPALQTGLDTAGSVMDPRMANPLPGGNWNAPMNGPQQAAVGSMFGTGMAAPGNFAPWTSAGSFLAGGAVPYLTNAESLASGGIGNGNPAVRDFMTNYALTGNMPGQTGADPNVASAITGASTGALGSLGQGQTLAGKVGSAALDPNGAVTAGANGGNMMLSNPGIKDSIDAYNATSNADLNNNTLRGIRQSASLAGGANSSREGAL